MMATTWLGCMDDVYGLESKWEREKRRKGRKAKDGEDRFKGLLLGLIADCNQARY